MCVAPNGDLVVACHSGPPDWGTGPTGEGRLFRIGYRHRDLAQPVIAWVPEPHVLCIGFDRPLETRFLQGLLEQISISYGDAVSAGDRFETLRPGYAVVHLQLTWPRYRLPVYQVSVSADRQTLVLATAAHQARCRYAIRMPGLGRQEHPAVPPEIEQHPEIDLAYAPWGVRATRQNATSTAPTSIWLPHPDHQIARQLLAGYGPADQWFAEGPESDWKLETQVDVRGLFRPLVQPGSALDYQLDEDRWLVKRQIVLESDAPYSVNGQDAQGEGAAFRAALDVDQNADIVPLNIESKHSRAVPSIHIRWRVSMADGSSRWGPIGPERFWLPWVSASAIAPPEVEPSDRSLLAAERWGAGRRWFFDEEIGCSKCHRVGRDGVANIGPDLGNLIHRDVASVRRDIMHPSFAINPDYLSYTVELHDGRVLTGAVRSEQNRLLVGDKDGKVTKVDAETVVRLIPMSNSIMPDGLADRLGEDRLLDLLSYLLLPPPRMSGESAPGRPEPRSIHEVQSVLAKSQPVSRPRPLQIVLVAGQKDHGPGEHDYPRWLRTWATLLEGAPGVRVSTAMDWPTAEQWRTADTVVFYQRGQWNPARAQTVDQHLREGKGLVYIHWAIEGGAEAQSFAERLGLASHAARLRFRHGPVRVRFRSDHPITRNLQEATFYDESYWQLQGDPSRIIVLGEAIEENEPRPLFWTHEHRGGRVFVSILGHYSWTFDDPLFRTLLLRGIAWSAKEPVDRFEELVWPGADVK